MNKNWLYLLVVVGLGLMAYFFIYKEQDGAFSQDEANFTVKDTSQIEKVFLVDLNKKQILLERQDSGWKVNNEFDPNPDLFNLLMEALSKQIAEQPVSSAYHDQAIRDLASNNIKVEIYSKKGKTHSFYVCKDPTPNHFTYMLSEGSKQPFVVRFPFINDFVGQRYQTNVDDWRSKRILYGKGNDIEEIQVNFKDSAHLNFKMMIADTSNISITPDHPNEIVNMQRAKAYLRIINELFCVSYDSKNFERDSILNHGKKMGSFSIKRKNESADVLEIYFRPIDQGTKGIITLDGKEYDVDYYYGYINHKDFVGLSIKTVEKMMRSFPEFLVPAIK